MSELDFQFLPPEPPPDEPSMFLDDLSFYQDDFELDLEFPFNELKEAEKVPSNHSSGIPNGALKMGGRINSPNDLKEYLQKKISGDKKIRFNKTKLFYLFDIFVKMFGWRPLNRTEKRKKELVFQRLFENKQDVLDSIEKYPSIIEQVLVCQGRWPK